MSAPTFLQSPFVLRCQLTLRNLRGLARPARRQADGLRWIGGPDEFFHLDPSTGRLCAVIWHDGYGKYHPTLYISVREAIRLLFQEPFVSVGLRSFPRIGIEIIRLKCGSMYQACQRLEAIKNEYRLT